MATASSPPPLPCPHCGTALDVTLALTPATLPCPTCSQPVEIHQKIGPYLLRRYLCSGGMGSIYEAWDPIHHCLVAIKILKEELAEDQQLIEKFSKEAQTIASLHHPNIVTIHQFGREGKICYIAMELVQGGSLDDLITQRGTLDENYVLNIGIQAAQGLQEALQHGLLHRDVKPGNILLATDGTVKIVDFGLALSLQDPTAQEDEIWGTPYYVPPEKLEYQKEDHRSDIYSLGASLFHALAGRPPFEATTPSLVAWKHLKAGRVSLKTYAPHVSHETSGIIGKCLERKPEDRFQSYPQLLEKLTQAQTHAAQYPSPSTLPPIHSSIASTHKKRIKPKHLAYLLVAFLSFLSALAISFILFGNWFLKRPLP